MIHSRGTGPATLQALAPLFLLFRGQRNRRVEVAFVGLGPELFLVLLAPFRAVLERA